MHVLDLLSLDEANALHKTKYEGLVCMAITRREWDFVSRTEHHWIRRKTFVLKVGSIIF